MPEIVSNSVLPATREHITLHTSDGLALVGELAMPLHPVRHTIICLHPNPLQNGYMDSHVLRKLSWRFPALFDCAVLRFNFRGVGRSQGSFDHGTGELSDAASALDWAQTINPEARACWIAGFSFGAWIGMQLLMRRPEIEGFISVAPPANLYDFCFLAPCPSSGLIVQGDKDEVVPEEASRRLADKLSKQRDIDIDYRVIKGANHFFTGKLDDLNEIVSDYVARPRPAAAKKREKQASAAR